MRVIFFSAWTAFPIIWVAPYAIALRYRYALSGTDLARAPTPTSSFPLLASAGSAKISAHVSLPILGSEAVPSSLLERGLFSIPPISKRPLFHPPNLTPGNAWIISLSVSQSRTRTHTAHGTATSKP
eukprot:2616634-Rhodomonas_salina.6